MTWFHCVHGPGGASPSGSCSRWYHGVLGWTWVLLCLCLGLFFFSMFHVCLCVCLVAYHCAIVCTMIRTVKHILYCTFCSSLVLSAQLLVLCHPKTTTKHSQNKTERSIFFLVRGGGSSAIQNPPPNAPKTRRSARAFFGGGGYSGIHNPPPNSQNKTERSRIFLGRGRRGLSLTIVLTSGCKVSGKGCLPTMDNQRCS